MNKPIAEHEARYLDAVQAVRNMMIKELTGMLTHDMTCLARALAAQRAKGLSTAEQRARMMEDTLNEVYPITNVLIQQVMNAKKVVGGLEGLTGIADALQEMVAGNVVEVTAFKPFLPDELYERLKRLLAELGGTIEAIRDTAFGRLLACGRKITEGGHQLVDDLIGHGYGPLGLVRLLELDSMGEIIPMPRGEVFEDETPFDEDDLAGPPEQDTLCLVREPATDLASIFTGIRLYSGDGNHEELFEVAPELLKQKDGALALVVRVRPRWLKEQKGKNEQLRDKTVRMEITVPQVVPLPQTDTGHMLITLPHTPRRLYRPRFHPSRGESGYWQEDVYVFLQELVAEALQKLGKRRSVRKAEVTFNNHLGEGIRKLPLATPEECMVRRYEYEVIVEPSGRIAVDWEVRGALLLALARAGYDILTTSKNHPGHIVTKAGKYGVAPFIAALNPFALYGQGKRRSEGREQRKALTLMYPEPPLLLRPDMPLPGFLLQCLTNLRVLIANVDQLNQWAREGYLPLCFDTLLACPSALEKLALKSLLFKAEDQEALEQLLVQLKADSLTHDPPFLVWEASGDGLQTCEWRVRVHGPLTCLGKIKAAVGPIKGVMTLMPLQLFTADGEPIDLVICWDTIDGKEGLDAYLYAIFTGAGVDPVVVMALLNRIHAGDPEALKELIALAREQEPNARQPVRVVYEDGRPDSEAGEGLVGWLPFYRPVQTTPREFKQRGGNQGIKFPWHAMLMARTGVGQAVDWQTPDWQHEEFDSVVSTRALANKKMVSEEGLHEGPPTPGGTCSSCGAGLTGSQRTYSQHHVQQDLCLPCVKRVKKEATV